jgi:p-hydroxybenzoate 3-monooxygenase
VRTQVAIVGAGPAGLLLGRLLDGAGVDCVVLEARSRDHVEGRVRAGVLEQGSVETLVEAGVGDRALREGLVHEGIELRFGGVAHRIDMTALTGRTVTVYGQQEVVKDLVAARVADGRPLLFEVEDVAVHDLETERPSVGFRHQGADHVLECEVVAGCDGFHGICRQAIPDGVLRVYEREYPFAWLGILADAPPSTYELIYCHHERGFALHSLRSPSVSRLYLQCDPDEDLAEWPDDRIWAELHARFATQDGWELTEGPITDKGITPMRSFVAEPMRWGRLVLAGDAAHIVPPTGAKGLNLALADVRVLARALTAFLAGDARGLDAYSDTCLQRVWRVQHFSWWMTSMLHRFGGNDPFEARLQRSQLDYVCRSSRAAATLAENYVGLPFD